MAWGIRANRCLTKDGAPFLYAADTAWNLFHRLSAEEAELYLSTRAAQGFNVVQASLLCETDDLKTPNRNGDLPFASIDERTVVPNERYFSFVDAVLQRGAELGITFALLPMWGDKFNLLWGIGPQVFNAENAERYASFLAERYAGTENILWVLGGDRPLESPAHAAVIDALGRTLKEKDGRHLITFHPCGCYSSADFVLKRDYIDFHMVQSGHSYHTSRSSFKLVEESLRREGKPCLDGECRYEDHPPNWNTELGFYYNDADVRQNLYANMFAGACGFTYGNHCVWDFNREPTAFFPKAWQSALRAPGAGQIAHLKRLLEKDFSELAPCRALLPHPPRNVSDPSACRSEGRALVYFPLGQPSLLRLDALPWEWLHAYWINPKSGARTEDGIYPCEATVFVPAACGKGNDAVLVLEKMQ